VTAPPLSPKSTATPTSASRDTAQLERLVHGLVYKERQSRGVTPLELASIGV
jgi:hypothetical protein